MKGDIQYFWQGGEPYMEGARWGLGILWGDVITP